MKYLNEESQFTRVSDAHAKAMMESMGYTVPSLDIDEAPVDLPADNIDVYRHESKLYSLTEEVVDGSDDRIYVRVAELDETFILKVDESGREMLVEAVTYEDADYNLEGLYTDENGDFFVCMEAVEVDEGKGGDPFAFGGKKGDKSKTHKGEDFEDEDDDNGDPKAFGGKKGDKSKTHKGEDYEDDDKENGKKNGKKKKADKAKEK